MFRKPAEVPEYEQKRAILKGYKEKYALKILVETGTFMGDTVEYFKGAFEKVISIELAEELAKKAQKRFEKDGNVTIIQGDSGKVLKDLVKHATEPFLFWLDGHYSSEFYIGDEYIRTARTDIDTPVEEELQTILSSNLRHVILIDDARLFTGLNDYPSISKLKRMVRRSGKNYIVRVKSDIIRIEPSN